MKYLYPLGSECYINHSLDLSHLKERKIFKSPFNGTRLISDKLILPITLFLSDISTFCSLYSDRNNWFIKNDGNDIQAYNLKLNLRRCHCKTNDFEFIEAALKSIAVFEEKKDDTILLCDINDYLMYEEDKISNMIDMLNQMNGKVFIRKHSIYDSMWSINQKIKDVVDVKVNVDDFVSKNAIIQIPKIKNDDFENYNSILIQML